MQADPPTHSWKGAAAINPQGRAMAVGTFIDDPRIL